MPDNALPQPQVITVSELNRMAREALERGLPLMWIAGEVSNCKRSDLGHCYFTLKDAHAQVDCVMFRNRLQLLGWTPKDGARVEVRALPTLYEARGKFQLNVEAMRRAGLGALYEAFERLKAKLGKEGLFDAERKRPLARFPRVIGVVTSPQAAALRDVLTTLRRRMPRLPVILYPAPVQGAGAAERIAAAIGQAGARRECDALIVCRGGGSIEDLWAFNEEAVARAIVGCPIPVVSGVGHETDFTIADFAADRRAPTPTAAAEMACPSCEELSQVLAHSARRLQRVATRSLEDRMQRLDYLSRRLVHPGEKIRGQLSELRHFATRFLSAWERGFEDLGAQTAELARRLREGGQRRLDTTAALLARLDAHVQHMNPQAVLERGYSITESAGGAIVRDGAQLGAGESISITFARGRVDAEVKNKK
jgi:exodeoxyribonuclease VII large subunit